ncbi:MAG: hypothetical protein ABFS56_17990 [Pseudomonadota bacterium]
MDIIIVKVGWFFDTVSDDLSYDTEKNHYELGQFWLKLKLQFPQLG